jgi:hypothetical protein
MRLAIVAAGLLLAGLLRVGPAFAQNGPVALVTAVVGNAEPPVEAFSEIPPGTTLRMPEDGKLTFLFYETCERITVAGGRLAFAGNSFDYSGGHLLERKASPCPRKVTVRGDGTISGVLLRSLGGHGAGLKLPTRPALVFTGKAAKSYRTLEVSHDGKTVFEAPLAGPEFTWPADAQPLTAGAAHTLTLLPSHPGAKSVRLDFTAVDPSAGSAAPVTVVRLE